MVTKRKTHKERDSGQTERALLDAVGDLLGTSGFSSLKTNNIARRAGKDKNLIRYHFGSLEDLLAAYIREKDYWPPFFERFRLNEKPESQELRQLFTGLMQENFRFFAANGKMQQIIRWQISEGNALLRGISDAREREGAKLLAMTDPLFQDSGINFRALLALLLGGSYYTVLHAVTNKSTVSGIDANLQTDREAILQTISQVIGWAWQAAGEKDRTK
ncbi:TetR/AcrR family transcriptional regulator [Mucilaginibacter sp. dw_454]|uniref:TetR/AcrR family transcriptional regulator n=1 Tax=Mucilaginibacter sp. dw_454 TaxID=2720079 RepID=UPI001BD3C6A0|nr:TetR/AcrR family transcriptional regulator [Mucilaginibacter sp. dw_454]